MSINDLDLNALVMEAIAHAKELGRLQLDGTNTEMFNVCSKIQKNSVAIQMRLNYLHYRDEESAAVTKSAAQAAQTNGPINLI